jgi:ferredoxin
MCVGALVPTSSHRCKAPASIRFSICEFAPQSLGVSAELRERGYALMCVGYPLSDLVLETVPEDEVYDLQFGDVFASRALNPSDPNHVELDPFALEIANMDE